ncbi:hypothetical protein PL498_00630 [Bacteroides xylanisolvens]|uniref:hypothetical protein n=1 Tax=Bacteroides xylanisolvens TaxID=371601 RepID=UPI0023072F49|nr:hypothetical protein [Bacteroides xylanisolvens]MDB0714725.1 hypothetical protein [Bacteroides xylanisolvens]MDB0734484.1 hypothetical protein [Bacteroides xylanisolvens]
MEQKIFEIEDLKELEEFLQSQSEIEQLRERLFAEFLKYADYKNAGEWNKAVRLCESLAIIGWGNHEALEALRGQFFNGNPTTCFQNKFGETRFVDAIWSKRINGFTMEQGRTSYCFSPDDPIQKQSVSWEYEVKENIQDISLESQRNWIPKNPVWIKRIISNCYENSKAVIESVDKELQSELNRRMRPEKYGRAINQIIINCSYSYYDHAHCKTNYVIADEKLKLKQKDFYPILLTMFTKKEIEQNGYYLRNRFEFGPFRADTGKIRIGLNLEKEFSELSHPEQKLKLSEYILFALNHVTDKLKKKKLDYDFDLMLEDFNSILTEWKA